MYVLSLINFSLHFHIAYFLQALITLALGFGNVQHQQIEINRH